MRSPRSLPNFVLLAAALSATAAAPSQTSQGPPVASTAINLDHAEKELGAGHLPQALAEFQALEATGKNSPTIEHQLALAYYETGHMAEAAAAFGRALALDPNDREAVQLRGLALYRTGHTSDAIPLLEQVRQWVAAGTTDVDYILGLCLTDTGRYDDARRAFAEQYRLPPDSAAAYLIAGQLFLKAHLAPAAIAAGKNALGLDAHLPLAHFLLGEAALYQQDIPAAMQHFEAEQSLNPAYPATYDRLADAYTRQARYDDAQVALNRAIILDPTRTGPYILLGKVMLKRGDAPTAEMYLRRANRMDPNNYIAHALLAQALRSEGRADEAARESKLAEALQGDGPPQMDSVH